MSGKDDAKKAVAETWALIATRAANAKPELGQLNPPATPTQVQTLEGLVGARLPDEFRLSMLTHDGGASGNWLCSGEELLAVERITEEWLVWKHLLETDRGLKTYRSTPPPEVKSDWWNPLWIPITSNHAGDHWCLDLDPTPVGQRGQIIRMWHDMDTREVAAKSYLEFVSRLLFVDPAG